MSKKSDQVTPTTASFRPSSYWEDNDPLAAILRNVKGANRRQIITDYWNAGRIEDLDPDLLSDETVGSARNDANPAAIIKNFKILTEALGSVSINISKTDVANIMSEVTLFTHSQILIELTHETTHTY